MYLNPLTWGCQLSLIQILNLENGAWKKTWKNLFKDDKSKKIREKNNTNHDDGSTASWSLPTYAMRRGWVSQCCLIVAIQSKKFKAIGKAKTCVNLLKEYCLVPIEGKKYKKRGTALQNEWNGVHRRVDVARLRDFHRLHKGFSSQGIGFWIFEEDVVEIYPHHLIITNHCRKMGRAILKRKKRETLQSKQEREGQVIWERERVLEKVKLKGGIYSKRMP